MWRKIIAVSVLGLLASGCRAGQVMHRDEFYVMRIVCRDKAGEPVRGAHVEVRSDLKEPAVIGSTDSTGSLTAKFSYGGCHEHAWWKKCDVAYPTRFRVRATSNLAEVDDMRPAQDVAVDPSQEGPTFVEWPLTLSE